MTLMKGRCECGLVVAVVEVEVCGGREGVGGVVCGMARFVVWCGKSVECGGGLRGRGRKEPVNLTETRVYLTQEFCDMNSRPLTGLSDVFDLLLRLRFPLVLPFF